MDDHVLDDLTKTACARALRAVTDVVELIDDEQDVLALALVVATHIFGFSITLMTGTDTRQFKKMAKEFAAAMATDATAHNDKLLRKNKKGEYVNPAATHMARMEVDLRRGKHKAAKR